MIKNTVFPVIIILIVLCSGACQKQDNILEGLNGTYIEVDTQTDTIFFSTNSMSGSLLLNRAYETRNGNYLPGYGSGPYSYQILHDSIYLHWMASSQAYGRKYFFRFNESSRTFNIQVFTFFATNKAILTFKKLE
jgi:hypothetical protein